MICRVESLGQMPLPMYHSVN